MDDVMGLIDRAHHGDERARAQLVEQNMGLVWSIVRRFSGRGTENEDLFQIGAIGLMKAIDKFDCSFEVRFSTYAVPMIMGEIKRFMRDDGMIKVSRPLKELSIKAKTAREKLQYTLGREPTIEEVAGEIGASREEVAASIEAGAEVESIYRPINREDEGNGCLMEQIPVEDLEGERLLDRMVLAELIRSLNETERRIIIGRYFENKTQTAIAKELAISQVQVSRLEKKILLQLRQKLVNGE